MEDKSLHIQESNQSSNGINSRNPCIKIHNNQKIHQKHNKQKNLYSNQRKWHTYYRERIPNDCMFFIRKHEPEREDT